MEEEVRGSDPRGCTVATASSEQQMAQEDGGSREIVVVMPDGKDG